MAVIGCVAPAAGGVLVMRAVMSGAVLAAVGVALGCSPGRGGSAGGDAAPPTGRACTQIGCQDGLVLRVLPAAAWPHGQYRFDIEHDGATVVCTGALPLPPCDRRAVICDAPEPTIVESGCALEPAAQAFGDVVFSTRPADVAVVVSRDGMIIGSGRWSPVYRTHQPNGPGCEPVCTSATVDLVLAFAGHGGAVGADPVAPEPVLPDSFKWFSPPGNPGLAAAWVVGAEDKAAPYALRVKLSAGGRIAPHTHPDTRHSTVLAGTLYVGFGATFEEATMVAVPAGGVYVAPASQPHFLWARDGEVVYQESGVGPTGTTPATRQ